MSGRITACCVDQSQRPKLSKSGTFIKDVARPGSIPLMTRMAVPLAKQKCADISLPLPASLELVCDLNRVELIKSTVACSLIQFCHNLFEQIDQILT